MNPQEFYNLSDSNALSQPHHILTGSFRSLSLYLLAFSPLNRTLHLLSARDRVYATSWAWPPQLSSWEVEFRGEQQAGRVDHINNVPITATSSYIFIPPPFTHVYSTGGPTGEVHLLDANGAIGDKIQEILFIPPEQLEAADKTRVALRTGSHGIEFSLPYNLAFVPVLGTDSIEVYKRASTGHLHHIHSSTSPRGSEAHDGPRHVKVHPNGKVVYAVTEHSNFLDAYTLSPSGTLTHLSSTPLIPPHLAEFQHTFRGDTLLLTPPSPSHPAPYALFATTRGTSGRNGWLSIVQLDSEGHFADKEVVRWETPTSGGKANAIDLLPKNLHGEGVWIVLTDDEEATKGAVRILEWDGWNSEGVRIVAEWSGEIEGASHALWLN
ncbi:hypothetical protein BDQ17DRAFT_1379309 [Cyathus striatus]|nr:hypothetical protein BDQ17DRAFT_1379309 [Cyathus striatus]